MPRNLSVRRVVALVVALAKLHNFCIDESDIPERVPQTFYRDRFHMMNADSGYVMLQTDDRQQNTAVPAELIHRGEHFEDVQTTNCEHSDVGTWGLNCHGHV